MTLTLTRAFWRKGYTPPQNIQSKYYFIEVSTSYFVASREKVFFFTKGFDSRSTRTKRDEKNCELDLIVLCS